MPGYQQIKNRPDIRNYRRGHLTKKFKGKMNEDDIFKFNKMLESDTVAPENKTHQYEFEPRPDNIDEKPRVEQKPEDFEPKRKTRIVKQIKKPNLKGQQELF